MLLRSVAFLWVVAAACKSMLEACFDTSLVGIGCVFRIGFINHHVMRFVIDQPVGKYTYTYIFIYIVITHFCIDISYLFGLCEYSGISGWTTCSLACG